MSDLIPINDASGAELYSEGGIPVLEVVRLLKEHGPVLAEGLLNEYRDKFQGFSPSEDGVYHVDEQKNIYIWGDERGISSIKVFITPTDVLPERNGSPGRLQDRYADIEFHYRSDEHGQPKYDGAVIHQHDKVRWISTHSSLDNSLLAPFWQDRINMKDLERVLGPYLKPKADSQVQLPP